MSELSAAAERLIGAPADRTDRCIADFRTHHPRFLSPAFSDLRVEQGGVGTGTVHTFRLTAGGRTRGYRMRVEGPEPGRRLIESDRQSSLATTWTVTPEGDRSRVHVETHRQGLEASAACSSGCSRRACCAASTPTSRNGWTATPAPHRATEQPAQRSGVDDRSAAPSS